MEIIGGGEGKCACEASTVLLSEDPGEVERRKLVES